MPAFPMSGCYPGVLCHSSNEVKGMSFPGTGRSPLHLPPPPIFRPVIHDKVGSLDLSIRLEITSFPEMLYIWGFLEKTMM